MTEQKVYKDQCWFCFHTPEMPGGLLICTEHKIGFCPQHVTFHLNRRPDTCSRLVEYVRRRKALADKNSMADDQPSTKITKLAIGLEGGAVLMEKQYETIEKWMIYEKYPDPGTKSIVKSGDQAAESIISAESAYRIRELEALAGTWDGSALIHTKHADLKQSPLSGSVPKQGWNCQHETGCDKRENLWMNLTDGKILCGRKYADGSGGNNHAVEHYKKTKHPLAVNLGTITAEGADVYSYDEDEMVLDKNLDKHLRHFGIDMLTMNKTEKTMLEKELDLNTSWEYSRIQEGDKKLAPVYGPGFVGIHNLGNSCYMNSLLQALNQIPEIRKSMNSNTCEKIFKENSTGSYENVKINVAKVFHALQCGEYSIDPAEVTKNDEYEPPENGIRPYDFRHVIGKGHREFSTKKQQDVEEYAHHLLNLLRLHFGASNPLLPVGHLAKISTVDSNGHFFYKFQCIYDVMFHVNDVPNENDNSSRPKFNLYKRMRETIEKPQTAVLGCVAHLCNLPPYLFIKVNRHAHAANNRPIKLKYDLEVDDAMDLNFLRCDLPRDLAGVEFAGDSFVSSAAGASAPRNSSPHRVALSQQSQTYNAEVLFSLLDMGFSEVAAKKALLATRDASNVGIAVDWLMERIGDPALEIPDQETSSDHIDIDENCVETLKIIGYTENAAREALKKTNNNVEAAVNLICESDAANSPANFASDATGFKNLHNAAVDVEETMDKVKKMDGNGVYTLLGVISHIGLSTDTGHYVYHGRQADGRWIIFNDEKVAVSENPPIENGYIYLFKRV